MTSPMSISNATWIWWLKRIESTWTMLVPMCYSSGLDPQVEAPDAWELSHERGELKWFRPFPRETAQGPEVEWPRPTSTDKSVKVAIAGCTIATHAACQIIQTSSRQAYGPVAQRIGQFAFNVVFVSLHNDDRIDLLKRKAYEPEFDALSKRMRSFANP